MSKTPSPNVKKSPRTGAHPDSERSRPSTSASRAPEHQRVASAPPTPLIPLPRYEGPAKLIYLFGRHFSLKENAFSVMHSVEYFDPRTKTWGSAGSIPFVRYGYAVASFRDKIWIAGGYNELKGYSSLVNIFDPVTNAWTVGPQLLTGRSGLGLIEYNGKLHAIGGATGKSPENVIVYTSSTEILASPENQTWTIGASMKFARVGMGVALLRQRIYVLGGEQHCEAADRGRIEYFCSVNGNWTEITNIRPNLDNYEKLIAFDEFLYVFGEKEDEKSNSAATYCYAYNSLESGDQAWQPQRGSYGTCIRPESVVVQVDGNVYFIGGLHDQIKTDNIPKYDIENHEWDERWWSCELARIDAKAVVVDDHRRREPATPKTPSPNFKKSPRTGPYPVSERSQSSASASRAPEHQPVASAPLTPLIPHPRYEGPAKLIYLFGTRRCFAQNDSSFSNTHVVEYFDPRTKTWGSAGSIPFVRYGFAVASFRDKIWIAGGYNENDGYIFLVNIFDPVTNAWTVGPRMLTGRSELGLIEYNGKLHAIGGSTRKTLENVIVYTSSTEILDSPESLTWTIGASMKFARSGMGVALLRQRIYVLGGEQQRGAADRGRMEYFCSVNATWTEITNVWPNLDEYKKLIAYDEFLYVFGEKSYKRSNSKYCYAYNSLESRDRAWRKQHGSYGTCIRPESVVVQVDGNVYFIGGPYHHMKTDDISKYDIENQEWDEQWWSFELPRLDAKAVVVDDHRQREPATPSVRN